jgi:AcrR family transcriptional regulator
MPSSRRDRPAKPALTRAGIVAAAVRVLRAEGLGKVTMRRLATELDTGAASLYVYVANTDELHAAVLDELLGGVRADPAGTWEEQVEQVLLAYTEVLLEHPALARSALTAWPHGPHYLALIDTLLGLLAEGGVPPEQAAWGVDLLLLHAAATASEQATRRSEAGVAEDWNALSREIRESTLPHIRAAAGPLLGGTPTQRRAWAVRALLRGITTTEVES